MRPSASALRAVSWWRAADAPNVRRTRGESVLLETLKSRARQLKADTYALYLAARHPDTPLLARLLVGGVAAYALSPVDLIPDFVPVFGYLDDLLIVPAGIALAVRLVPAKVMAECRRRAAEAFEGGRPVSRAAAAVVISIWLAGAALVAVWVFRTVGW